MKNPCEVHELVRLSYEGGGSLRLRNALASAQAEGLLENISADQIALGVPWVRWKLLQIENLGVKTLRELESIVTAHCLNSSTSYGPNELAFPTNPAALSIPEMLSRLDSKSSTVLSGRLGLGGQSPKKLAEIGLELNVTRERVRQIESKAIALLRRMFSAQLNRLRLSEQDTVLQCWGVHGVILKRDEREFFTALLPEMRLVIRIEYRNIRHWLDSICTPIEGGWLMPNIKYSMFEEVKRNVEAVCSTLRIPCPIEHLQSLGIAAEGLQLGVLLLSEKITVHEGYLLPSGSTRRAKRAARVHRLLNERGVFQPISLNEIRFIYKTLYKDDQCSARDLLVILFDNPHLFLNLYEAGWLPLGQVPSGKTKSANDDMQEDFGTQEPEEELLALGDSLTIRESLANILIAEGPQSFNDLRRLFVAHVGDRYSKASVGPVLISTDEFPRIAPGIYAHRTQLNDPALLEEATARLLLNRSQCEIFCRAMWAGESEILYLLWSRSMQAKWAEWCEENGHLDLLSSLLSVCDISSWPLKAGDRSRWLRLRDQNGVYSLEERHIRLEERLPTYRDFLACVAQALKMGHINWIAVNRVTGFRVEDRHAVTALSILISLRIVEPAMHWQQRHQLTESAFATAYPLISSVRAGELVAWPRALLKSLRSSYEELLEPGWTTSEQMHCLFDALAQQAINEDFEYEKLNDADEFDQLKKNLADALMSEKMQRKLDENMTVKARA